MSDFFFHEKINFLSSSQRVILFLLHRYECFENKEKWTKNKGKTKEKQRNDISNIFTSEDMENQRLIRIPSVVSYGKYVLSILR